MLDRTKLKELMEARSIEQKELAYTVGVSETAMSFFLNGLRQPKLEVAQRMAKYLGVTVDELLTEETA